MDPVRDAKDADRRAIFVGLSSMTALALTSCATSMGAESASANAEEKKSREEGEGAEVTPGEDLMQEHGVLERVLLVYTEAIARLREGGAMDPQLIVSSAGIVRRFVEDYHEKLEETFVFPRLEQMGKQVALVATLKEQHVKGRQLTDAILATAQAQGALDGPRLSGQLETFIRMYRPHAAREETVLFPAFRRTLDKDGYHELGERFEEKEHQLFGEGGFDDIVSQVSAIETALGIHELAQFTPR
ncbi:MAG: hemerythrin domain-containing protein [Polyangiaceae bacterium]|nr:hemerythrin domain-containing protein [Polyangiaceae bacterium]